MADSPAADNSKTSIGETSTTSCERCRRRKIKCDRRQPCSRCRKAGTECMRGGTGEKQRPIPKSYVQALEGHVASLEVFIQKIAAADEEQRAELLAGFCPATSSAAVPASSPNNSTAAESETSDGKGSSFPRTRSGQIRRQTVGSSTHFYGGTSLFQIPLSPLSESTAAIPADAVDYGSQSGPSFLGSGLSPSLEGLSPGVGCFEYPPHHDVSQRLMASFFTEQYQYNMCIYREYFLRDYDVGSGRYYSDMLLYAICALGAFSTGDPTTYPLSEVFSSQAQALLPAAFEHPDLTALQALILLAQRETGHGKASKGWLFCGMAIRIAHEMGLHLDPANWETNHETSASVDREILRRVYWAAFNADKQLSLYFGRPPALYLHESDVRDTIRLPYPPDWEGLLETYIAPGTSVTAFEDGIAFVGAFIYQTELSKIIHTMITDLFENRRVNPNSAAVTATVQRIHVSLTRWLANLPGKLYWNQWTVGKVPACVIHLHMLFHTVMIILHRPPLQLYSQPDIATSEDVEVCYESLQAILRLMRSYARFYKYECLPLDLVQILSTAASTILMKRHFEQTSPDDIESSRSLTLILDAMDAIREVWPCVREVKDSILKACQGQAPAAVADLSLPAFLDFGILSGFPEPGNDGIWNVPPDDATTANFLSDIDIGPLVTDDFLGGKLPQSQE